MVLPVYWFFGYSLKKTNKKKKTGAQSINLTRNLSAFIYL